MVLRQAGAGGLWASAIKHCGVVDSSELSADAGGGCHCHRKTHNRRSRRDDLILRL